MKAGINFLLWTGFVSEDHFQLFDTLKSVGFDGVEIPCHHGDEAHYRKLGHAVRDAGLECTTTTVLPDHEQSAVNPDPAARIRAADRLKWVIDRCVLMGSLQLAGPYYQKLAEFTGQGATEDEKQWVAEVHRAAADHAAQATITMAVEPLNRFECYFLNTIADAKAHVERVGRPNFGVLYDTFHANIEEKDPIGCIAQAGPAIRHVHFSENDRGTPGRGHIDFASTARALKDIDYDGWITIEAFGLALPELAAATKIWRPMFSDPLEVCTEGLRTIKETWSQAGD